MFPKRLVPLLAAAFVLFFNFSIPKLASGQRSLAQRHSKTRCKGMRRLKGEPGESPCRTRRRNSSPQAGSESIATMRKFVCIETGQPVELFPDFHELAHRYPRRSADRCLIGWLERV